MPRLAISAGGLLQQQSITMCGICGFTGERETVTLTRMTDALIHRGPDEDGYYGDGKVNLGMRRLSIIDVATGHQPIHNEDETIWVVFNGEIYNYIELRKDLEKKGHTFYTDHSDTEVIVHLYEEYGREFCHKINGMFAIALWDKNKDLLLLVRDRMGVKPLFYSNVKGNLVFASEIKSILGYPAYSQQINLQGLYHYFSFKHIPSPLTAFKDIFALPPGSMLLFNNNSTQVIRWWRVIFNEKKDYDAGFVKANILSLLEDATKLRLNCDVPFGAYLSGGLDSSTIVALMARFTNKPVKTFSLGYEDELKNKEADLYFARRVSKFFNTEHHEYIMSHKELINDITGVITSFDQPFSGTISTYFLTRLISKHVKVALSGDAADELFGSYLSHRLAQPLSCYNRLGDENGQGRLTESDKKAFNQCDMDFLKRLFAVSNGDEIKWRYALYLFSDEEKNLLLGAPFKEFVNSAATRNLVSSYFKDLSAHGPLNRILEMEWNTQLPDQVLAFVDFLSMAHSVEIRSPFLDYRLVEFCATIPDSMKIKEGVVKYILKETVKDLLPQGVAQRPKEGFVLPLFDWMTHKLKSYCLDILSDKNLRKHDYFNRDHVKSLINSYYSGDKKLAGKIWNIMVFQLWWESYFG